MKYALTKAASIVPERIKTAVSQAWTAVSEKLQAIRAAVPTIRIEIGHIDLYAVTGFFLFSGMALLLLSPTGVLSGKIPENAIERAFVAAPGTNETTEKTLPEIEAFPAPKVVKTMTVSATAYNSLPSQTDGDPFTTASGTKTHPGTVAACFPFGTKLEIIDPKTGQSLNGITYTVEDRTAKNNCNHIDIWMETLPEAKQWGRRTVEIRVVEPVDYNEAQKSA